MAAAAAANVVLQMFNVCDIPAADAQNIVNIEGINTPAKIAHFMQTDSDIVGRSGSCPSSTESMVPCIPARRLLSLHSGTTQRRLWFAYSMLFATGLLCSTDILN